MTSLAGAIDPKITLTFKEQIYFQAFSLFFLILPTRVFIAISSDVLQLAIIIVPFIIALMTVVLTTDTTFGLPLPEDAVQKLADRHGDFSRNLAEMLRLSIALLILTLVAKSFAVWLLNDGWLATLLNHLAAFSVGGLVAVLIIKIKSIQDIFGYLSVGADIALRVRAKKIG